MIRPIKEGILKAKLYHPKVPYVSSISNDFVRPTCDCTTLLHTIHFVTIYIIHSLPHKHPGVAIPIPTWISQEFGERFGSMAYQIRLITYLSIGYIGAITLYYIPETSYLEDHSNKWVITVVSKLTKDRAKHCVTPTISQKVSQHAEARHVKNEIWWFLSWSLQDLYMQTCVVPSLTLRTHDFWGSGEGM